MQIGCSDADTVELSVIIVSLLPPEEIPCVDQLDIHGSINVEIIVRGDDGIGAARNAGIREASADKLVFLDDDAIPCDGYLELVSVLLDEYPIVAGRAIDPGDDYFSRMSDSLGYN